MPSLIDFQAGEARKAKAEIVRFNHRLAETGLFTDEALATLIDEFPRDQVTICTMKENPPPDERWIAGDSGDLSGAELVEAARRGHLWVSPRSAMTKHPKYRAVFEKLMAEFCIKLILSLACASAPNITARFSSEMNEKSLLAKDTRHWSVLRM